MKEVVRLHKYLAQAGLGSRRSSERMIQAGRVAINGKVCETLGTTIDPEKDTVTLDGNKVLMPDEKKYIILNKPEGYMVSRSDPHQPKTIYTLLPKEFEQLHPVGRLDQNSCGLLLLTNDGELTEKLLHPRFKLEKVYKVQVKGKATDLALNYMRTGVDLSDGKTQPARVVRLKQRSENSWIEFGLKEGRNRQIRRMCRSVGLDVVTLERTAFGPLLLGNLREGAWRSLTEEEVHILIKKTKIKTDKSARSQSDKPGPTKFVKTEEAEAPLDWKPGPRTGAKKDGPREERTKGPRRVARPVQGEREEKRSPASDRPRAAFSTRARSSSSDKPRGYSADKSRGYSPDRSQGDPSDKPRGYSADKSRGYSSERSQSSDSDKPRGYSADRSRSSGSDKSRGYSADKSRGYSPERSQADASDKPRTYSAGRSRPSSSDKPRGYSADRSRSSSSDKPRGYSADKSRGYSPERSQADASDKPRTYSAGRSRSSSSDKPRGYSADRSRSSDSDKPRGYSADRSRSSGSDKPRGYSADKSRSSSSDKPRTGSSGKSRSGPSTGRSRPPSSGRPSKGPKRGG
jgi:23S rRNA pseudouridine2605 synthase